MKKEWFIVFFALAFTLTSFGCGHSVPTGSADPLAGLLASQSATEALKDSQLGLTAPTSVPAGVRPEVVLVTHVPGDRRFECSGVIIHPEWVLTAAHCFCTQNQWGSNSCIPRARIRFQNSDTAFAEGNVVVHPDYDPAYLNPDWKDIALLHMDTQLFSSQVRVIQGGDSDIFFTQPLRIYGFGLSGEDCDQPPLLNNTLGLGMMQSGLVANSLADPDGTLQAFFINAVGCDGDSGGPVFNAAESRLVGVFTATYDPLGGEKRGVVAATIAYEGFMRKHVCHTTGVFSYCDADSLLCKCGAGQGHCDSDAECHAGLECRPDVGDRFGLPAGASVCMLPGSQPPPLCEAEDCNK